MWTPRGTPSPLHHTVPLPNVSLAFSLFIKHNRHRLTPPRNWGTRAPSAVLMVSLRVRGLDGALNCTGPQKEEPDYSACNKQRSQVQARAGRFRSQLRLLPDFQSLTAESLWREFHGWGDQPHVSLQNPDFVTAAMPGALKATLNTRRILWPGFPVKTAPGDSTKSQTAFCLWCLQLLSLPLLFLSR